MPKPRDAAVELLRQTDNPAANQLLMAMLRTDDPAAQQQAIEVTLDRGYEPGMVEIVARFPACRADVMASIVGRARDLSPALRKTIRDNRTEVRVNSVEIIRRSCDPSLAYLLAVALRDGHTGIRRAAAEGLETYVRSLLHDELQPRQDGSAIHWRVRRAARQKICEALSDALEAFHVHGEQTVIRSAMLLADVNCRPLWQCLAQHHDARADVVLELLAGCDDAEMVDFFYQALVLGHHRGRLLSVLRKAGCGPFLKTFLARGYLLTAPAVADGIGRLRAMHVMEAGVEWIDELPRASRRHLARFALVSGLSDETKLSLLIALSESPDRSERLDALFGALALGGDGGEQLVRALLTDPDEQIQRVATRGLLYGSGGHLQQTLMGRLNSEFESVRNLASRRLATYTFENYWDAFDRLSDAQRRAAGRAVQKLDAALDDRLRARLASRDESDQGRAMQIVRLLGLEPACSQHLIRLSHSDSSKIRATAVRLMGNVHSPDAIDQTREALEDVDPRVQANAVESLEQQGDPQLAEDVAPMLAAADNRIVANAAKALAANLAEALPAIQRLLTDDRPEYRLSGLWVMGQLHLPQLFREIVRICREDQSHRVRNRAIEILTQVRDSLSQGGRA